MMTKKSKQYYCYKCGALATSKEHVPPKCLFPEEKDIKTTIFRNNLITVPSCDEHNSKKSKDDEFLMMALTGILGNNVIGYFHAMTKVRRALERRGSDTLYSVFKEGKAIHLPGRLLMGRPDGERLNNCLEHIACGLFYDKFKTVFLGECRMLMDFLQYTDDTLEKYKQVVKERIKREHHQPRKEGSNPQIFRYQFFEPDEYGLIALVLTFYEGATVYVVFIPEGSAVPFNMAGFFIESGMRTTIVFDEDVQITFNQNESQGTI